MNVHTTIAIFALALLLGACTLSAAPEPLAKDKEDLLQDCRQLRHAAMQKPWEEAWRERTKFGGVDLRSLGRSLEDGQWSRKRSQAQQDWQESFLALTRESARHKERPEARQWSSEFRQSATRIHRAWHPRTRESLTVSQGRERHLPITTRSRPC